MFLGWYDPDKNRPIIDKYHDALDAYRRKFKRPPEKVLTSVEDAAAIHADGTAVLVVEGVAYIPRHTFYVGIEEAAEEETEWAR